MKLQYEYKDSKSHSSICMSTSEESLAKQLYEKMKKDFAKYADSKESKHPNTFSKNSRMFSTVVSSSDERSNHKINQIKNKFINGKDQNSDLTSSTETLKVRSIETTSKFSSYLTTDKSKLSKTSCDDTIISGDSLNYLACSKPIKPAIENQNSNIIAEPTRTNNISIYKSVNTSNYSKNNEPAVLPKCIVNRIIKSMHIELFEKSTRPVLHTYNKLIKQFTNDEKVESLNWPIAIETGKIMIAEIIDLTLTANIDKHVKHMKEINELISDLQEELLKTCRYLSNNIEKHKNIEIICLNLLMLVIKFEMSELDKYAQKWFNSNRNADLNECFIKLFNEKLLNGDITKVNRLSSFDDTKSVPSAHSPVKSVAKSDITQNKSLSPIDNFIPSDSIITLSRLKKCMLIVKDEAIKLRINNIIPAQELRDKYMPLAITNDSGNDLQSIDPDQSLTKITIDRQTLWKAPIQLGQQSIMDLLEFIINTTAQDSLISKDLYRTIIVELDHLKFELLCAIVEEIQSSRKSNANFNSFCFELLAEIIIEECAVANYLFASLNTEDPDYNSMMLGKLYKNFTLQYHDSNNDDKLFIDNPNMKSKLSKSKNKSNQISENDTFPHTTKIPEPSNNTKETDELDNNILKKILQQLGNQTNEINNMKNKVNTIKDLVETQITTMSNKSDPTSVNQIGVMKKQLLLCKSIQTPEFTKPKIQLPINQHTNQNSNEKETNLEFKQRFNCSIPPTLKIPDNKSNDNDENINIINDAMFNSIINSSQKLLMKILSESSLNNRSEQALKDSQNTQSVNCDENMKNGIYKLFHWCVNTYLEAIDAMKRDGCTQESLDKLNSSNSQHLRHEIEREILSKIVNENEALIFKFIKNF